MHPGWESGLATVLVTCAWGTPATDPAARCSHRNFDPESFSPDGIGLDESSPRRLTACSGGSDPGCWPPRRVRCGREPVGFLDKSWMHVGTSGGQRYAWIGYGERVCPDEGCDDVYTSNAIAFAA